MRRNQIVAAVGCLGLFVALFGCLAPEEVTSVAKPQERGEEQTTYSREPTSREEECSSSAAESFAADRILREEALSGFEQYEGIVEDYLRAGEPEWLAFAAGYEPLHVYARQAETWRGPDGRSAACVLFQYAAPHVQGVDVFPWVLLMEEESKVAVQFLACAPQMFFSLGDLDGDGLQEIGVHVDYRGNGAGAFDAMIFRYDVGFAELYRTDGGERIVQRLQYWMEDGWRFVARNRQTGLHYVYEYPVDWGGFGGEGQLLDPERNGVVREWRSNENFRLFELVDVDGDGISEVVVMSCDFYYSIGGADIRSVFFYDVAQDVFVEIETGIEAWQAQ